MKAIAFDAYGTLFEEKLAAIREMAKRRQPPEVRAVLSFYRGRW